MGELCSSCGSNQTIKNGKTHYGKQNHKCKTCGRQFVLGGSEWFISAAQKSLIDALLLERISLAGISRVLQISESWLSNYIKEFYQMLPDDLNADLSLPHLESYLADRFDEEINRLEKKTKASETSTEVEIDQKSDNQHINIVSDVDVMNDLLLTEIYEKERGARLEVLGIQLDEMWSFVQKKENKQWIWLALNPANRQIIAFHIGGRGKKDAQIFYENIPDLFKQEAAFFTDYWKAYAAIIPEEKHFAVGKDSG